MAINDAGLLIGIPTAGRRLDTGGSLGMLIPINDAIALLERNGIYINSGTSSVAGLREPEQPEPIVPPEVQGLPTSLPSTASSSQPRHIPTQTPVTASTSCSFAFDKLLNTPDSFQAFNDGFASGFVDNDGLHLTINTPGRTITNVYEHCGTGGETASFTLNVKSAVGLGEILVIVRTEAGPEWIFSVDPEDETWSLYRTVPETNEFFHWIEPISYAHPTDKRLRTIRVITNGNSVSLYINERSVTHSANAIVPEMPGSLMFGFGICTTHLTSSGYGQSFEATFERVTLSDMK